MLLHEGKLYRDASPHLQTKLPKQPMPRKLPPLSRCLLSPCLPKEKVVYRLLGNRGIT